MCAFSFSSKCSFSKCLSEMHLPVFRAIEVPTHAHASYYMPNAWLMIVKAGISNGVFDIGPKGSRQLYEASAHRVV
jgi:hypothetical protein